jgi:hypothetical protein
MNERCIETTHATVQVENPVKRVIDQLRNNIPLVPVDDAKLLTALHKTIIAGSLTALHELHELVWETVAGQNFVTGHLSDATLAALDAEMTRTRDLLPTAGYLSPSMREYLLTNVVLGLGELAASRYTDGQKVRGTVVTAAGTGAASGTSGTSGSAGSTGSTGSTGFTGFSGTFAFPDAEVLPSRSRRQEPPAAPAGPAAHAADALSVRTALGLALAAGLLAVAVLVTYFAYCGSPAATLEVRVNYDVGTIIGGTLAGVGLLIAAIAYAKRPPRPHFGSDE